MLHHQVKMDHDRLRETLVWCRLFTREAQRELRGEANDAPRAANQLRAMLEHRLPISNSSCLKGELR
jgi:hypothetical protein